MNYYRTPICGVVGDGLIGSATPDFPDGPWPTKLMYPNPGFLPHPAKPRILVCRCIEGPGTLPWLWRAEENTVTTRPLQAAYSSAPKIVST